MKKIISLILCLCFLSTFTTVAQAGTTKSLQTLTLLNNTRIKVSAMDNMSSDLNTQGQEVSFQLSEDTIVDNKVVLKAGTIVTGNITSMEPRSYLEKGGKLTVDLLYTTAVNGSRVPLRGTVTVAGKSKIGKMVALSVIITPLFLLMRGDHAVISAGTKFNGYVDQDCYIPVNAL